MMTMMKHDETIKALIAAYTGPIKNCRPGRARAPEAPKKRDRAGKWLGRHYRDIRGFFSTIHV
jgi:hypothetical protein